LSQGGLTLRSADTFSEGDLCLLVDRRGRKYLLELVQGAVFGTHTGIVRHEDLIGSAVGTWLTTAGGSSFLAIRPRPLDYVLKMRRLAQVVYPKDFGAILWRLGIRPGFRVLEVGLGSGSLSIALLLAVGDKGRVVSLDIRKDHAQRAIHNVSRFFDGACEPHSVVVGDAGSCLRGSAKFDAAVVDVPEPWAVLEPVTSLLRPGCFVACFSPSALQVRETADALESLGYAMIDVVEVLERSWYVRGKAVRPDHRMVAHTGFLTVGCKARPAFMAR